MKRGACAFQVQELRKARAERNEEVWETDNVTTWKKVKGEKDTAASKGSTLILVFYLIHFSNYYDYYHPHRHIIILVIIIVHYHRHHYHRQRSLLLLLILVPLPKR